MPLEVRGWNLHGPAEVSQGKRLISTYGKSLPAIQYTQYEWQWNKYTQGRLCPQDHWLNFPFNFDPLGLPSPLKWVSGCITAGTFLNTQIQFCAFWCVFGPIYWLHSWVLLQFLNSLYSFKAKMLIAEFKLPMPRWSLLNLDILSNTL